MTIIILTISTLVPALFRAFTASACVTSWSDTSFTDNIWSPNLQWYSILIINYDVFINTYWINPHISAGESVVNLVMKIPYSPTACGLSVPPAILRPKPLDKS